MAHAAVAAAKFYYQTTLVKQIRVISPIAVKNITFPGPKWPF